MLVIEQGRAQAMQSVSRRIVVRLFWPLLCCGFLMAGLAGVAVAQDAASEDIPDVRDEMLVTTRKKAEDLMTVPLAITAFDAQKIEEAGIASLDDVANFTPGLNFFNPIGEFLPVPVIRGIAPTNIFGENNAAIFIDGVYVSGREGLNFSQLDLERIEINKGPQAALYGRNAFSGAINYITAKPEDELGAKVDLTAGDEARFTGRATATGPLMGKMLTGRLAVTYDTWDGSYDNSASGVSVGGYEFQTYQASLKFEPAENFTALASFYFSDDEIDANATTSLVANCEDSNFADMPPNPPRLENFCGEIPELDGKDIPKIAQASGEERKLTRGNLTLDWETEIGTFTSVSSYVETDQRSFTDGSRNLGENQPYVYCNNPVNFPFPGTCANFQRFTTGLLQASPGPDTTEEFSQELRFSSDVGRVRYDLGVYYFEIDRQEQEIGVIATQSTPSDFVGFGPFVTIIPGVSFIPIGGGAFGPWFQPGGDLASSLLFDEDVESWAVFGAVDVDITDALRGRAEIRHANEELDLFVAGVNEDGSDVARNEDWDLLSWRIGLDYTLANNWLLYGSVAQAEKPGDFDSESTDLIVGAGPMGPITENRLIVATIDPEKITSFELGAKGRLWDDRVNLDVSVYFSDWEDIVVPQIFSTDPASGLPFEQPEGLNINAADADVLGVEIQTDVAITEGLSLNLTGSWTDSELKDAKLETFADWPTFAPDGDVAGNKLLRQPEWMGSGSLRYERGIFSGLDILGRLDVTYQSKVYNGNDNQSWYPARTYVNVLFGIGQDNWRIEVWGRNILEDESPVGGFRDVFFNNTNDVFQEMPPSSIPAVDFFPFRYTVTHPRLRTLGATLRVKFGSLL